MGRARGAERAGWFEIEDAGFVRQQAGRDPAEVVREVVQNAFDAQGASRIDVRIDHDGKDARVVVEDDGEGFTDPALAFTVFLSGKHDDPTKRGRKGRGLKEAVAASAQACVEALGTTLVFDVEGRRRVRRASKNARARGSRVTLLVRRWRRTDIEQAVRAVQMYEPPTGVEVTINGRRIAPHDVLRRISARLQTVVMEGDEGIEVKRTRDTEVVLMLPRPGEAPHLHELGIPVCPSDTPWHVDVQQRIPLADHRNTVPVAWTRRLKTQVLDAMAPDFRREQFQDGWVSAALEEASESTRLRYKETVFGTKVAVMTPGDTVANVTADEELGMHVIDTRHLPRAVRDVLREHAPSTRQALVDARIRDAERSAADDSNEPVEPTAKEEAVCALARWIARAVLRREISSGIEREIMVLGNRKAACWVPSANAIFFSRTACGRAFFDEPLQPGVLQVIVHEVAHAEHGDIGHVPAFYRCLERVAGKVAHLLLVRGDEAREVVASVRK